MTNHPPIAPPPPPPPPPSEDPPPEKALVFTVSDAALLVTLPALFVTVTV